LNTMKQVITKDQLLELSEKGKGKLREWWKPQLGDKFVQKHYNEIKKKVIEQVFVECDGWHCSYCEGDKPFSGKLDYPLLSIGQMIEFLGEQRFNLMFDGDFIKNEDLCDRLWEAIKQVLK